MGTKPNQIYLIAIRIKPYQEKISFNMAFHVACIISCQRMRPVLFRYRQLFLKKVQYLIEFIDFFSDCFENACNLFYIEM